MIKYLRVTMPDESQWDIPITYIANNKAAYYHKEHSDEYPTFDLALEHVWELFNLDDYEIEDWAENNMNWDDVIHQAVEVKKGTIDYEEGWANGDKQVIEKEV